jgi:hypothetical protein
MKKSFFFLLLLTATSTCAYTQIKDSTDITGTWISMLDKNKRGFTFTQDGYVYFLHNNVKEGGKPEGDPEGKDIFRYEVGKIPGYFTIDFIHSVVQNKKLVEVDRMKGLFIYLKDGRIRAQVGEARQPRPDKLESGKTDVITKQ